MGQIVTDEANEVSLIDADSNLQKFHCSLHILANEH